MRAAHSHRQAFTLDQVVLLIALLAMARKFIILDLGQVSTGQLLGLATITLVLGVTYGLMRERDDRVTNIAKERST